MSTRTEERVLEGLAGAVVIGGVWYVLSQRKSTVTPTPIIGSTPTPKVLNIAPQNLPNSVTQRRCGTGYLSFGSSTTRPGYIIVGKYVNQKLASQYYRSKTNTTFDQGIWPANWVGGYDCSQPSQQSNPSNTAAQYGWLALGNGAYRAQSGATLSGLGVVTNIAYATLAAYNCLPTPYYVYVGQTYYAYQNNPRCSSFVSPPKAGSAPQSGYFDGGAWCGQSMYVQTVPQQWLWGTIPSVPIWQIWNVAWHVLGHPLNTANQPLTKYLQLASYDQSGVWTGTYVVVKKSILAQASFVGSRLGIVVLTGVSICSHTPAS